MDNSNNTELAQPGIRTSSLTLLFALLVAVVCYFGLSSQGLSSEVCWTATLTLLCAVLWITEALPIPVTALIPLSLFPVLGVLSFDQVSEAYGSSTVLLVLGGFILSKAMVKSGAHSRVALTLVNLFGAKSSRNLVFGFMAAAAVLSMWISNAATSLMLLPVAYAILDKSKDKQLATPLLLGLAYACSIGGLGTPIGTPANLVFRQVYQDVSGIEISFLTWMTWGLPVVLIFLPVVGFWLTRNLNYRGSVDLPEVGQWSSDEKRVFTIFVITALAWITRTQPFGGWSELVGLPGANDASIALVAVISMFVIPVGKGSQEKLLDWETASQIPWGILLLLGSGFAIAEAFVTSGLSAILGDSLSGLTVLPVVVMMAALCLVVTFLTEMTSNTATTALLMPVLAAAAMSAGIDPILLMLPAALSSSCAFMLPIATSPNIVAFSTGAFSIKTMAREGFVLNLFGVVIITSVCYWLL